jgi:hypothetical protein
MMRLPTAFVRYLLWGAQGSAVHRRHPVPESASIDGDDGNERDRGRIDRLRIPA